ncbi:S-methyl-5-thioribose-1-phosphate isomerase, partial [Bacteroidota bacterium]
MLVNGKQYQSIWLENNRLNIINQNLLPWIFEVKELKNSIDIINSIKNMEVRGAPLIGVTAAFGVYFACKETKDKTEFFKIISQLKGSRPTAINLNNAVDRILNNITDFGDQDNNSKSSLQEAIKLMEEEKESSKKIGRNGLKIIEELYKKNSQKTLNILTHCNAGWLACVDYGTALAPIYAAFDKGLRIHVWVDETRPRNQGSRLTAWELGKHGVPHTIIPDNTGGFLMQKKMVDLCIVGSDRTSKNGDVINKIGTYLKALAAKDNNIPFYVAFPSSTIDLNAKTRSADVPIEQRPAEEVKFIEAYFDNKIQKILLTPENSPVANYAFDITPAKFITAYITEKG